MRCAARALVLGLGLTVTLAGCAGRYFQDAGLPPAPPRHSLAEWPWEEYWTGIVFNGNKIGYAHVEMRRAADGGEAFEITGESAFHLRFMGFDKRISLRAHDRVKDDFALESFEYAYHIDGSDLALLGERRDGVLRVKVTNAGRTSEQTLPLQEAVYPASAIDMVPVLRGLVPGAEYRYTVYVGESQRLAEVQQRVEGYERSTLFEGEAWKVTTDLEGLRTTTWIDRLGRPVLEIGMAGVIIAGLEDERRAKRDLARATLGQDEALLELALIRTATQIAEPRTATRLKLVVTSPAAATLPPDDPRQQCRPTSSAVECELRSVPVPAVRKPEPADLQASVAAPSSDSRIRDLASAIAAGKPTAREQAQAMLDWIGRNIRKEPADVFSALDVLATGRAECQGHAYLFAALARANGIPTRVANGLVYSAELEGFAYHTWNESLIDGQWIAIDPMFGQFQADATHFKLLYGENLGDLTPLAAWIGATRIEVLEVR
ncbi:MAG TPA: transglutaminase-like domain-containing protein [Burkholderiales bacterium]|nr:transglutaminase-like domain-containing protein [Burkholderiales bacterium]